MTDNEVCKQATADTQTSSLTVLLENLNSKSLLNYYSPEDSVFKKRIDKLNIKFYIETEKVLSNNLELDKRYDQLFLILFKQISLYIEEIDNLNTLLRGKQGSVKEKLEEVY
jgi:hypothetical protein